MSETGKEWKKKKQTATMNFRCYLSIYLHTPIYIHVSERASERVCIWVCLSLSFIRLCIIWSQKILLEHTDKQQSTETRGRSGNHNCRVIFIPFSVIHSFHKNTHLYTRISIAKKRWKIKTSIIQKTKKKNKQFSICHL